MNKIFSFCLIWKREILSQNSNYKIFTLYEFKAYILTHLTNHRFDDFSWTNKGFPT